MAKFRQLRKKLSIGAVAFLLLTPMYLTSKSGLGRLIQKPTTVHADTGNFLLNSDNSDSDYDDSSLEANVPPASDQQGNEALHDTEVTAIDNHAADQAEQPRFADDTNAYSYDMGDIYNLRPSYYNTDSDDVFYPGKNDNPDLNYTDNVVRRFTDPSTTYQTNDYTPSSDYSDGNQNQSMVFRADDLQDGEDSDGFPFWNHFTNPDYSYADNLSMDNGQYDFKDNGMMLNYLKTGNLDYPSSDNPLPIDTYSQLDQTYPDNMNEDYSSQDQGQGSNNLSASDLENEKVPTYDWY